MADESVLMHAEGRFEWRRVRAIVHQLGTALDVHQDQLDDLLLKGANLGIAESLRSIPNWTRRLLAASRVPGGFAKVPVEKWFTPLTLAYGGTYAEQDAKTRVDFLRLCLSVIDGVDGETAKRLTYAVRDPQLAGDIAANRPEAFPGVQREVKFLVATRTTYWLPLVRSGFLDSPWMCYALMLREDFASAEVERWIMDEFPKLLHRSFDLAATLAHASALVESSGPRSLGYAPTLSGVLGRQFNRVYHSRIRDRMEQRRWTIIE